MTIAALVASAPVGVGSKNIVAVKQIQLALRGAGHEVLVDGGFGGVTETAVKDFQRRHGLGVDGKVGPQTGAALDAILLAPSPAAVAPPKDGVNPVGHSSMTVRGNRLYRDGAPVLYRESPNGSGVIRPRFLVIHFTAGSYAGAVSWMTQKQSGVSAHLCIGEAGEITQLAPFNRRCNHAGQSAWKGVSLLNGHSIGFELANLGQISGAPGAYRVGTQNIPDNRVMRAAHRNGGPVVAWHTFMAAQIEASTEAARAVCRAYDIKEIVGHDDIAPKRKSDPGPAFDMPAFRRAVLG